jgi:hypothetical protein
MTMKCSKTSGCCRTWLETNGMDLVSRVGIGSCSLRLLSLGGAVAVPFGFACHPFWGLLFLVFSVLSGSLAQLTSAREGSGDESSLGRLLLCRGIEYLYLVGFWMAFWSRGQWTVQAGLLVVAAMILLGFLNQIQGRLKESCDMWLADVRARVHYYVIWAVLLVLLPWAREGVLWVGMMLYFIFLLIAVVRCAVAAGNEQRRR